MLKFKGETFNEETLHFASNHYSADKHKCSQAEMMYEKVEHPLSMRCSMELNYNPATHEIFLFGGASGSNENNDISDVKPNGKASYGMCYNGSEFLVFGGYDDSAIIFGISDELWTLDGDGWNLMVPETTTPPPRSGCATAYDNSRDRMVIFGGRGDRFEYLEDTWEWDGVKWLERTPETGPGQKYYHAAAYDSRRHRTIIFGGEGIDYSNDTWEYYNADTECCDTLGVILDLSQITFHPGDPFACTATVCNNTGAELPDLPLFVLLEVIPPFTWPEGAGSFYSAYFHAALTDPDMTFLYGAMDSVEFG